MERWLPEGAKTILNRFSNGGYEAYVVGGCVRDALMGIQPHDWDICTSALPEETMALFSDCAVHPTGIQHGTVLIVLEGVGYEVTTYRVDGSYTDHRHPQQVSFVRSLKEDLARRDFTINAMAWNPSQGLVDCFGGQADLTQKLIRCVGDPARRFEEDGLRILRGLRFAARFGFALEEETAAALRQKASLLEDISAERILEELKGILVSPGVEQILRDYRDVFAVVVPELKPMFDHPQYNYHHCYDVWEHTLHAVGGIEPELPLRMTMLFHDAGKPRCFVRDAQGVGHFRGHPEESVKIARTVLNRLHCDHKLRDNVLKLIEWHDRIRIFSRKNVWRMLAALGETQSWQLFRVMRADIRAQSPETQQEKLRGLRTGEAHLQALLAEHACCKLEDLAIDGKTLMDQGEVPGVRLGWLLEELLRAVMEDLVDNEEETLLSYYEAHLKAQSEPVLS